MGTGAGRRWVLTSFVLVAVLLGAVSAVPATGAAPIPARYLDDAIALLRENALDRDKVDWRSVEGQARHMAERARTTTDTYTAIRFVIHALGNPHIALLTPDETRTSDAAPVVLPTAKMVERDIAMLTDPPVALLTSGFTASAAEATLIAFRGLDRARSFGRPTAGFATGNFYFPLSDGAALVVTEAHDMDRIGTLYGNMPIPPDQALPEDATPAETVAAAQAWLHAQPGCHGS